MLLYFKSASGRLFLSRNFCYDGKVILTGHILFGAAAAKPLANLNPLFSFAAAFVSHFAADLIPHWEYNLSSLAPSSEPARQKWNFEQKLFIKDFSKIALDIFLGALVLYLITKPASLHQIWNFVLVISGSILPDFLQFIFWTTHWGFLKPLHKFHHFINSKIRLEFYPLIGIPLQILISLVLIYFLL